MLGLALSILNLQDSFAWALSSGILTLVSILVAIGVFFYKQHNEKKNFNERLVNASNAIVTDLEDLEKNYCSGIFPKITVPEKNIDFSITSMGLEYYQVVVNSGLILYYGERTQFELSNLYYNMSLFNEWIKEFNHIEFYSSLQGPDSILILDNIGRKLTNHEKEIKLKIPVVKILVYEEIKKFKKRFII